MPSSVFFRGNLLGYVRKEIDTGLLITSVDFNPQVESKKIKGNLSEALGVTLQHQTWVGDLGIDLKGTIIPDAGGNVVGLAAVTPGQSVVCLNFAAASDGVPAVARHGFTRDPAKLLVVLAPKTTCGDGAPEVTVPMEYCPWVDKDLVFALPLAA